MSWEVINQILGLAAIDQTFAQALLNAPVAASSARGFHLTPAEQQVFSQTSARTLHEFSLYLLQVIPQSRCYSH